MRTQTISFNSFIDGSYKEPIQYYGDFFQIMAWKLLMPFITVLGLELVLFMCDQMMQINVF